MNFSYRNYLIYSNCACSVKCQRHVSYSCWSRYWLSSHILCKTLIIFMLDRFEKKTEKGIWYQKYYCQSFYLKIWHILRATLYESWNSELKNFMESVKRGKIDAVNIKSSLSICQSGICKNLKMSYFKYWTDLSETKVVMNGIKGNFVRQPVSLVLAILKFICTTPVKKLYSIKTFVIAHKMVDCIFFSNTAFGKVIFLE